MDRRVVTGLGKLAVGEGKVAVEAPSEVVVEDTVLPVSKSNMTELFWSPEGCSAQSTQMVCPFKLMGIFRTFLPFSSNTCSMLYWISAC